MTYPSAIHPYTRFWPCYISAFFQWLCNCICRGGVTPLTSPPPTPKTRSGTHVSVAGDGSATGGIRPWTPGLRWVSNCARVCVRISFSLFTCISVPGCSDRSLHSRRLSRILSATSAVEVGRSVRSPEAGCHCGLYPCRARYSSTPAIST